VRTFEYKHVLKPSIAYLERCGSLMLDSAGMAEFLGVPAKALAQVITTDRLPLRCRMGYGRCQRWSVLRLLEWVEAGCPGRHHDGKQQPQAVHDNMAFSPVDVFGVVPAAGLAARTGAAGWTFPSPQNVRAGEAFIAAAGPESVAEQ